MTMLVTKFSHGKYRNEGELFAEPISEHNVKLMAEMIALQALRTLKRYDTKVADKLYIGLIKDLHHMHEVDYIISEGYDCVQTAACFLYGFIGKTVHDIYGKDRKGVEITIKTACYREVENPLLRFRRKLEQHSDSMDFSDYKAFPADPVNCFEKEEYDYGKADAIMQAMRLTDAEIELLDCYMSGWKQTSVCQILGITRGCVSYRKKRIRFKYNTYIGSYV